MRHHLSFLRRTCGFLAILLTLACAATVLAHPEIVRTEPAADAQLVVPPPEIRIIFNEAVEAAFSDIQLFDSQGQRVDQGGASRSLRDPTNLILALPPIAPGLYTVVWQTVGSDGHKVVGNFIFTVLPDTAATPVVPENSGAPAAPVMPTIPPPPTAPTPQATVVPPLAITTSSVQWPAALLRAVMLLGALWCVGGWFVLAAVITPALSSTNANAQVAAMTTWRRNNFLSLLLLISGGIGFALVQTQLLAGAISASAVQTVLLETRLGLTLLARLGLALLLALLLATTRTLSSWRVIAALMIGGALLLSFSIAGHAAARSDWLLPVAADWLHLAASAIWGGGLITLIGTLPALLTTLDERSRVATLTALIVRFSTLALGSVIALTVSGTYAALLHIPEPAALWGSDYGRALVAKLLLFGILIALGAYQLLVIRPRFMALAAQVAATANEWPARFLQVVRAEVVIALLVIVAVGVLTNSAPPTRQAAAQAPIIAAPPTLPSAAQATLPPPVMPTTTPSRPFRETRAIDDLQITFEVTPASIGRNQFRVGVADATGQPVDVQKVELTLEMLTMEMGVNRVDVQPDGTGEYLVPEGWFSMVGEWRVRVTLRRADADDIMTDFVVPVGG